MGAGSEIDAVIGMGSEIDATIGMGSEIGAGSVRADGE